MAGFFPKILDLFPSICTGRSIGVVAQLGERIVRNDEVVGSIPINSTNFDTLRYARLAKFILAVILHAVEFTDPVAAIAE